MSETTPIAFVRDPAGNPGLESALVERATGSVTYRSAGACLIVGALDAALDALPALPSLSCSIFVLADAPGQPQRRLLETGVAVFSGGPLTVTGHLGDFTVLAGEADARLDLALATRRENGRFDLVLDLGAEPLFEQALPPFGYAHLPAGSDPARRRDAMAALDELVGEFDKPRYFRYSPDICAHSRSQLSGCSKCMAVCATGAIVSSGDGVTVDPWLCQGCGSCATVCPTGAMSYAYPSMPEAVQRTRSLSRDAPIDTLLLHARGDQAAIDALALPAHVLGVVVEEISAFGLDYWLASLAGGVSRIVLLNDAPAHDLNTQALQEQIDLLHRLLGGLSAVAAGEARVLLVGVAELPEVLDRAMQDSVATAPGGVAFAVQDDKRATVRMALDILSERHPPQHAVLPLPATAPFGRIDVDTAACTLCMACVSTCPAGALLDGQDRPALRMIEASCVQCGLCEQACPERAISLLPRYVWDSVEARRTETLHEEQPFHCIGCHKAFATQRLIDTVSAKLAGHWMFAEPAAMRRLKMCEDCRVKDLFETEPNGPDVHRGTSAPGADAG